MIIPLDELNETEAEFMEAITYDKRLTDKQKERAIRLVRMRFTKERSITLAARDWSAKHGNATASRSHTSQLA